MLVHDGLCRNGGRRYEKDSDYSENGEESTDDEEEGDTSDDEPAVDPLELVKDIKLKHNVTSTKTRNLPLARRSALGKDLRPMQVKLKRGGKIKRLVDHFNMWVAFVNYLANVSGHQISL